jgi:hypothetical protein
MGWEDILISLKAAQSHKSRPLQAAEWLAYEMRHDLDHQFYGKTKAQPFFSTLFRRMKLDLKYFDRSGLEGFALKRSGH